MTEYGAKLNLLGVTVKKYGPGTMKPLAELLKTDVASSTSTEGSRKDGGAKKRRPQVPDGSSTYSELSKDTNLAKTKTKKLRYVQPFDAPIMSQTNEKQRREARMLLNLFDTLKIDDNCRGKELKEEIVRNRHTPYRYIYLFLKTINKEQFIVGFISASRFKKTNKAVVDFVCPEMTNPPAVPPPPWNQSEMQNNFIAYAMLDFLWLNNNNGTKSRYESVEYENKSFKNVKDIMNDPQFKVFPTIGKLAADIMNFKTG